MAKDQSGRRAKDEGSAGLGSLLGGLGTLLERLSELADKGAELRRSGEISGLDPEGKLRGVYGFTIRSGLKGRESEVQVQPFGNVRKDERTGKAVVHEVREPMVDLFEEEDHVLVVAELPGVGQEDVQLEVHEDILSLSASKDDTKYRKEILLPRAFTREKMSYTCRNGVLRVRLTR